MKRKDIEQIATAGLEELTGKLKDARAKLQELNVAKEAGKLKNVRSISGARKDVARILTFITKQTYGK